ncbi:MAG: hypothetical protein IPI67_17860 [Myxococcales bacterium]|nr:hypothetical protein [Myxococcales bacterium]
MRRTGRPYSQNVTDGPSAALEMSLLRRDVRSMPPPAGDAQIVQQGQPMLILLRGTVVTEAGFRRRLIDGETITCVAESRGARFNR